ncbi:MAG: signal peptide peptidase SppA [Treponema sp.]|jgi:protease-4|nr:signal peptide peptidase SppA [Treponema sp.]
MKKKPKTAYYLELNLGSRGPAGGSAVGFTPVRFKPDTELETLRILKRAAGDKKLRGVLVNTSGFSGNKAFLWEIRNALENCKSSGKKIIGYFESADMDLYCMLSAADKIVMDEGGTLSLMGYAWGKLFVKESLDKIGVGFRELRYLDYKSANEMFSRTSISEADKEQYGLYLEEIFDLTKSIIISNRSSSEENFMALLNESIFLAPNEAKARNLVDAQGRREAIIKTIKALEFGNVEESEKSGEVFFISTNPGISLFSLNRKMPGYSSGRVRKIRAPEIAVVHARGNTDLDQGMGARNIAKTIRELAEKSRVKALVVRIDSPGGSAVAADYVAEAIEEAKKEIPVVVSMGQVAASGGYWAAMYASHIISTPYTLTGSIGVIGGWFFDNGLNAKLGLGTESLSRGEHADLLTGVIFPKRDLRDDEEAQFRRTLLTLYGEFVKKAAKGRNKASEDLESMAQGRVYSGLHAQQLGLVDSLGGYLDALDTAKKLAEIPVSKKVLVREYPKPKFIETITARFFASSLANLRQSIAPGLMTAFAPFGSEKNAELAQSLEDLQYRISKNGQAMPILPLIS